MPDEAISIASLYEIASRVDVVEAMRKFFDAADKDIAGRGALCTNRGACCRFGEFGHRLYVTTLEVVYFLAQHPSPLPVTEDVCPHAIDGMCHARVGRPLGCRVFYCDPQAQDWQGPMTEEMLAQLREMHVQLNVPYAYQDWLAILRRVAEYHWPLNGGDGVRLTIVD